MLPQARPLTLFLCAGTAQNIDGHAYALNARPQFSTDAHQAVKYPLRYFFQSHRLGGFINSATTASAANVQAVLFPGRSGSAASFHRDFQGNTFEYRQFYVATRDIYPGEEILDFYDYDSSHDSSSAQADESAWYLSRGLSHDVFGLLRAARHASAGSSKAGAAGTQ